jgi:hypothetical protein
MGIVLDALVHSSHVQLVNQHPTFPSLFLWLLHWPGLSLIFLGLHSGSPTSQWVLLFPPFSLNPFFIQVLSLKCKLNDSTSELFHNSCHSLGWRSSSLLCHRGFSFPNPASLFLPLGPPLT